MSKQSLKWNLNVKQSIKRERETRYYISDLSQTACNFYQRIRGYWGVENKVHYVRDVTQGEDIAVQT